MVTTATSGQKAVLHCALVCRDPKRGRGLERNGRRAGYSRRSSAQECHELPGLASSPSAGRRPAQTDVGSCLTALRGFEGKGRRGASIAFRLRPQSGAHRLFIQTTAKGRSGSNLRVRSLLLERSSLVQPSFVRKPALRRIPSVSEAIRAAGKMRLRCYEHATLSAQPKTSADFCPVSGSGLLF
jgi:hypothetical protein